ncbi:2-hydroxyisoflavanone dehydratase-like [Macadamia integrifolia]|uniref:2-hydroxyisoflavanone dehydratase-like n=1 Tax=Macadamia integrifolia TaxID=60698 RepID=UPI001C4F0BD5|nr:2-hydroxyisoflavanone dehydratase-like [Macadamia integrifolia]
MDSNNQEVAEEVLPFIRVYKNGRVERLKGSSFVPPSLNDPETGVSSKDIVISPESGISARLYLPKDNKEKLPLYVYFHGGGFCVESAFSFLDHRYLNHLVSQSSIVAVSVEYRLAPEHPLPVAYDDCWAAFQWVAAHARGGGDDNTTIVAAPETWLTTHADFDRVFVGGDSAGGNIAHNIALRAGKNDLPHGFKIYGALLVHPFFWGSQRIGSELAADPNRREIQESLWKLVAPFSSGIDDPMINPVAAGAPSLAEIGCSRVLVCVADGDVFRDRGKLYWEELKKSGWKGKAELFEIEGEGHAFHIYNPVCENAVVMIKRMASFLNSN